MKHRCAVCWAEQANHVDWFQHATDQHDALLEPFNFDVCEHVKSCADNCREHIPVCPGAQHGRRLSTEGTIKPRVKLEPKPFVARDGTVYIPTRLPEFS
jgi:hypothetical protein